MISFRHRAERGSHSRAPLRIAAMGRHLRAGRFLGEKQNICQPLDSEQRDSTLSSNPKPPARIA